MKVLPIQICILLFGLVVIAVGCKKDDEIIDNGGLTANGPSPLLPENPYEYENQILPTHLTTNQFPVGGQNAAIEHDNTPSNNQITNEGATLGRVLFYDRKLSANGTISCASCHRPEFGFSDPSIKSTGFAGGSTRRHSMSLANSVFYETGKFFWDERANTLEDQVLMPFQDETEMGLTLEELVQIVGDQNYYPALFSDAFGSEEITSDKISLALAQFIRSMVSTSSRYDQARAAVNDPFEPFPDFTAEENRGKTLFFTPVNDAPPCVSCHSTEAFINAPLPAGAPPNATQAMNNGLDLVLTDDLGVAEVSGLEIDEGKFKVGSLKNIAVTAPYMHDGRFATLEEVINHYSEGIQSHPNLNGRLQDVFGQAIQYNFTEQEKEELITFLNTLTDEEMLSDEKFSNPFP